MENNRIKTTAVVVDRIIKIVRGFVLAAAIVCAVFIPLTLIFGEKVIADASVIDLGLLRLELAGDGTQYINADTFKLAMCIYMACGAAICMTAWFFLKELRGILAPMKEGRPFEAGVSQKIRRLGWITLIGSLIAEVLDRIAGIAELKCYDLNALFNAQAVVEHSFNYRFVPAAAVVSALVLFFLSFVFRSGEELQRESDETL